MGSGPVIPVEKAVAFTRTMLRGIGLRRFNEHDIEDIAFDAYFYYWRGFQKTGNDHKNAFRRDILDQLDRRSHRRNKTPVPSFLTNVNEGWFREVEAA